MADHEVGTFPCRALEPGLHLQTRHPGAPGHPAHIGPFPGRLVQEVRAVQVFNADLLPVLVLIGQPLHPAIVHRQIVAGFQHHLVNFAGVKGTDKRPFKHLRSHADDGIAVLELRRHNRDRRAAVDRGFQDFKAAPE